MKTMSLSKDNHEENIRLTCIVIDEFLVRMDEFLPKGEPAGILFLYTREDVSEVKNVENVTLLKAEISKTEGTLLSVGSARNGTDRFWTNYIFEAGNTPEEIKAWLLNTDVSVPFIMRCSRELSAHVDDFW